MINRLSNQIIVTQNDDEIPSLEVLENEKHFLVAGINESNPDIYLEFSSRDALYDFARGLWQEAIFGRGGEWNFIRSLRVVRRMW